MYNVYIYIYIYIYIYTYIYIYIYVCMYVYKLCMSSTKRSIYISKIKHLFLNDLSFDIFQIIPKHRELS